MDYIPQNKWQWIAFVSYAIIEAWLGKTDRVKASSVGELVVLAVSSLFKLFKKEK